MNAYAEAMKHSGNALHHPDTRAVHAGRHELTQLGVHALPIDLSTTYPVAELDGAPEQLEAWATGGQPDGCAIYARLHNPTVGRFEQALAELEHAEAAVAFASGMAAFTALLLSLPGDRRHIVAVRPLYGGTDHVLSSGLLGCTVTWAEPDGVAEALQPDTGLVVVETPQNPTVGLVDIAAVAAQCGTVPLLVDSTFATPVVQTPIRHGATYVLHSATKFLGGHGDAMGGIIACDEEHARGLRAVRVATGGLLHPLGAYHLHRGLATLPVRIERMQSSAMILARRLLEHELVERVYHPSLPECDPQGLVGTQMYGPGSMLAFDIVGGYDAARLLLGATQLLTHAVSLGSTDTLIQHPASLTHRVVEATSRDACGVHDRLVRISVGLEHPDDLWADLEQALSAASLHSVSATHVHTHG
ncbi:MAG: Methionine gamma-lyase [Thermoleophilia bacterium]|nr:Methionine gamma-lyase [Thermoleophilia bacterium]MCZ4497326.1 Methionine gamma-lyase [Thermoleophilia bacterium]